MNLFEEIKSSAKGAWVLKGWLGEGAVPVQKAMAEKRARACEIGNGSGCPMNCEPNWWQRITDAVATFILDALEIKHRLNLSVSNEEKLHMCKCCKCCLRLKVWVPIETIRKNTGDTSDWPIYCWLKQELES